MGWLTRGKAAEMPQGVGEVARTMEANLEWLAQYGDVNVSHCTSLKWWARGEFAVGVGAVVKVQAEVRHAHPADAVAQLTARVEALVGRGA